jgi:hypothetical protein
MSEVWVDFEPKRNDFWNDPQRWDGITEPHKQMCWASRRVRMPTRTIREMATAQVLRALARPTLITQWRSSIAYIAWCDGDSMVSETEAYRAWVRATEWKG